MREREGQTQREINTGSTAEQQQQQNRHVVYLAPMLYFLTGNSTACVDTHSASCLTIVTVYQRTLLGILRCAQKYVYCSHNSQSNEF